MNTFNVGVVGIGLVDMAYAIRDRRAERASGPMALHCLELMEGLLASATQGRTAAHIPQRSAAVCTGASQSANSFGSTELTVIEQPAISSEVT
jgi:hypothetical protein